MLSQLCEWLRDGDWTKTRFGKKPLRHGGATKDSISQIKTIRTRDPFLHRMLYAQSLPFCGSARCSMFDPFSSLSSPSSRFTRPLASIFTQQTRIEKLLRTSAFGPRMMPLCHSWKVYQVCTSPLNLVGR